MYYQLNLAVVEIIENWMKYVCIKLLVLSKCAYCQTYDVTFVSFCQLILCYNEVPQK